MSRSNAIKTIQTAIELGLWEVLNDTKMKSTYNSLSEQSAVIATSVSSANKEQIKELIKDSNLIDIYQNITKDKRIDPNKAM